MVDARVLECYATLVDPFGSTIGRPSAHRGADYRVPAGRPVVAYEACTVVDSDLKSTFLGYSVVAKRHRDGKMIGWAHLRVGTRPAAGTVLQPGDQVGLAAGFDDYHGSSWTGPHSHTTEGDNVNSIYEGPVSDPDPDIQAAKRGIVPAGGIGGKINVVNYHWYGLTKDAMLAIQQMLSVAGLYNGLEDGDFGELSVKALQEWLKRNGFLPGDYEVDGLPHNPDQEAPSNYGYALQKWAKTVGYDGLEDGLPGSYTSQFLVKAANEVKAKLQNPRPPVTPPPPVVVVPPVVQLPKLPVAPEGFVFFPDLATSQGMFDFAAYSAAGGRVVAIKAGGSNASDSPYLAPAYKDQLDRARKAGQKIIHYWFNGNKNGLTPKASADFFATHASILPGDIVAIDVEDETATGTKAWTPEEAAMFVLCLQLHFPGIKGLAYMSDSVADKGDWSALKALGWELWNASWGANDGEPGVAPTSDEWATFVAWQYTSNETVPGHTAPVDGNLARVDMFDLLGWVIPVVADPEPEKPADSVRVLEEYFGKVQELTTEYAGKLA